MSRSENRNHGFPQRQPGVLCLVSILLLVVFVACQSPDEYDIEDTTPSPTGQSGVSSPEPTMTAEATNPPAVASSTATVPPVPSATPTTPPVATATNEPPPTSPPANTATPTPTSAAPPSAADVWNLRQFETDERVMVLTFDAGADVGYTVEILDLLAAEGIHASFGMTGPWAENNPDLIQRIVDEGHHLINHTWSHPHMPQLTSEERVDEILSLETLLRDMAGVELTPYFRPPFGEYDDATLTDLASHGYTINVMWTIDTLGWNGLTAAEINARVMDGAAPGAIVLMHVGSQSQDAVALPNMISQLREQGYSFATVDDLVRE